MSGSLDDLLASLRANPTDGLALEQADALLRHRGDWDALYELYADLARHARDGGTRSRLRDRVSRALVAHAGETPDAALAGALLIRSGDLLSGPLDRPVEAVARYLDSFHAWPEAHALDQALGIVESIGDRTFARELLDARLQVAEDGDDRRAVLLRLAGMAIEDEALGQASRLLEQVADGADEPVAQLQERLVELQVARRRRVDGLRAAVEAIHPGADRARAQVRLAVELLRGQPGPEERTEARLAWEGALAQGATGPAAVETLAVLERELRGADAVEELRALWERIVVLTTEPSLLLHAHRGMGQLAVGDPARAAEAATHLRAALELEPADTESLRALADVLRSQGEWRGLVDVLERARALTRSRTGDHAIQLEIATVLWLRFDDFEGAERLFRRILGNDRAHGAALAFYDDWYTRRQDWRRAVSTLAQRVELAATDSERLAFARRLAALAARHLPGSDAAIDAWRAVLALAPDDAHALDALGDLYREAGRWHALLELLEERLAALPAEDADGRAALLEQMADVYRSPDRLPVDEMVVKTLWRLLETQPHRTDVLDEIASRTEASGRWSELADALERRVVVTPDAAEALETRRRLAILYLRRLGRAADAAPHLQAVLEADDQDLEALRALKGIHRSQQDLEGLAATLRREVGLLRGKERAAALAELAVLCRDRLGDAATAARCWEMVLEDEPDNERALAMLAGLYEADGRWAELASVQARRATAAPTRQRRAALWEQVRAIRADRLGDEAGAQQAARALAAARPGGAVRAGLEALEMDEERFAALREEHAAREDWRAWAATLEKAVEHEGDSDNKVELLLELARLYDERLHDPRRSLMRWEAALAEAPDHVDAARALAKRYEERRNWRKLAEALAAVADHSDDPAEVRATVERLVELHQARLSEPAVAFDWARRGLSLDAAEGGEGDLFRLLSLAEDADRFDDLTAACEEAAAALQGHDGPLLQVLLLHARVLRERLQRSEDAARLYQAAIAIDAACDEALSGLEELSIRASDWPRLEETLWRRVHATDGRLEGRTWLLRLGELYEDFLDSPERALEVYHRLRALDPSDPAALEGARRMLERQQRWTDLAELYASALAAEGSGPRRHDLLVELGRVHADRTGMPERAIAVWTRVLEEEPGHVDALAALRGLIARGAMAREAAHALEGAVRRSGTPESLAAALEARLATEDHAEVRLDLLQELAGLYEHQPDSVGRAFDLYRELFLHRPESSEVWAGLGRMADAADLWSSLAALYAAATGVGQPDATLARPLEDEPARLELLRRQAAILDSRLEDAFGAIACYEEVLGHTPSDPELLAALTRLYRLTGDHECLLLVLRKQGEVEPDRRRRRALLRRAAEVAEQELGRPGEAASLLQAALALDGADAAIVAELERLATDASDWGAVAGLVRHRIAHATEQADLVRLHLELAAVLRDRLGDPARALDALEAAAAMDSSSAAVREALTRIAEDPALPDRPSLVARAVAGLRIFFDAAGDVESAVLVEELRVEAALDGGPEHLAGALAALRDIAALHADGIGDLPQARATLERALALSPGDRDTLRALVELTARSGAWEDLVATLDAAQRAADASGDLEARVSLLVASADVAKAQLGDQDLSIARLQEAATLAPEDLDVLRSLDDQLAAVGRHAERAEGLRRLATLDEAARLDALRTLAQVLCAHGDLDGGIDTWREVLAHADERADGSAAAEALDAIEATATDAGRWDAVAEAMATRVERTVEIEARRVLLYALAGVLEARLGQPAEALATYRQVLDAYPGDDTALRGVERLLEVLGEWEALADHLHQRLAVVPVGTQRDALLFALARLQLEQLDDAPGALEGLRAVATREPTSTVAQDGIRELWRLLNRDDIGWDASVALAEALEGRGDTEGLVELETVRSERFPDREGMVEGLRRAARRALEDLGDPGRAFDLLAQAFVRSPEDDALWEELLTTAQGPDAGVRLVAVVRDACDRLDSAPRRSALAWRAAEHAREVLEDPESAATILWIVVEEDPGHMGALERLEELHGSLDQWDRVLDVLARVVAATEDPAHQVVVLYQMGSLLQGVLGRDLEALELYERIVQIDPSEIDAYNHMEAILARDESWDDVARVLVRTLEVVEATPGAEGEAQLLKRRICEVLWERRGEAELAVGFAAELLDREPADPTAARVLAAMWEAGALPEGVGELLTRSHIGSGRWRAAADLLELRAAGVEAPADSAILLDAAGDVARDHLHDAARWYGLVRQAAELAPTVARLDTATSAAEHADAWVDLEKLLAAVERTVDGEELKLDVALRLASVRERHLDDPESAAKAYQAVLARDERNMEAAFSLERLYRRTERWEDLVELFEQMALISEAQGERVALYMKAVNLWDEFLGMPERAADDLHRVLEIDPHHMEARGRLERTLLRTQSFLELGDAYRDWIDAAGTPASATETRFKLAFLLAEHLDNVPEALEQLEILLQATPGYPAAVRWLESLLDRLPVEGDEAEPDSPRLAVVLLLQAQYRDDTPWQRWARVLEVQLAHAHDVDDRATLLIRLGELLRDRADDPETALQRFGDALALRGADLELEDQVEALAAARGLPGPLRDLYLRLVEAVDDADEQSRYLIRAAEITEEVLREAAEAAVLWRRVAERQPDHPRAAAALEADLEASGETTALAALLEQRLEKEDDPDVALELRRRIADIREQTGRPDLAVDHLRALLAMDPSDLAISERLEAIASEQKDWVSLVGIYRERLDHLTDGDRRVEILSRLAQIFERYLGRIDEAVACYRQIFDINPNNLYAITSLERLYPVVEGWHELLDVLLHKCELFASPRDKIETNHAIGKLHQEHLGSPENALDHYRVVLEWDPRHEPTIDAIEQMIRTGEHAFAASLVIEPLYEAAEDWRKLVRLYSMQLPHVEDAEERSALHMRAAELWEQRLGDPDQAIASLAHALREDITNQDVRTALTEVADRHDRWRTLVARVGEILDEAPELDATREVSLWLARLAEQTVGDREEGIRRYRRVLDVDELNQEALGALERLLLVEERWSDLLDLLGRRVAAAGPAERQALRLRIAELMLDRLRDADASLALLTELLADDATRDKAVQMLERLAGRHPEMREDVLGVLEPVYRRTERWDHMARLLELSIAATRDTVRRAELGHTLGDLARDRLARPDVAFDAWCRVMEDDPSRSSSLLPALSELAGSLDRWADLADAVDRAADAPDLLDQRLRYALLLRSGEIRLTELAAPLDAEERLKRALDVDPQSAAVLELLERLYETSGRHADLITVCDRRLELPVSYDEQRRLLGKLAAAARAVRDTERASDAYNRLLELDSTDRDALRMLELLHESSGEWANLAVVLEREASIPGRPPQELAELRGRLARLREERLHDTEGAIEAWEEVLELHPESADAISALDRLFTGLQMWEELRGILERQAQLAPTDKARIGAWHRLARLHERELGDVEGAIDYNQRILDLDRGSADAINELVRLFHKNGRWRELAGLYDAKVALAKRGPERNTLLVKSAEIWERHLDDPDRAMDNLQEVLDSEPEHLYALKVLARLRERHGDWMDALEILEQLLPQLVEPEERLEVLVKMGRLQAEQGDDDEAALRTFASVIEIDPNHRGANEALRALYARRERWTDLIEVCQRQLQWAQTDKEKAVLFREMALVWRDRIGRRDQFLRNIEKAYELRPADPETVKAMLEFYEQVQDWEQVAPLLEWLVGYLEQRRMHQHVPKYAHRLGLVQERLGQRDKALQSYRRAYQQDATYFPNLLSYGRLLIRAGRYDQALIIYQAMQLQQHDAPDDVKIEIFFNLGQICMKQGEPTKARHYFQRILRIDRSHGPTLDVLSRLGDE